MKCTHCDDMEMKLSKDETRYECPQCHRGIPIENKTPAPATPPASIFTIQAGIEFGIGLALGSSIVGVILGFLYYLFFIRNTGTPQP